MHFFNRSSMLVIVSLLALAGAMAGDTMCLTPFELCQSSGECVLDASLCGKCKPGEYLCPQTPSTSGDTCVADAKAYTTCPGLKGTHLDPSLSVRNDAVGIGQDFGESGIVKLGVGVGIRGEMGWGVGWWGWVGVERVGKGWKEVERVGEVDLVVFSIKNADARVKYLSSCLSLPEQMQQLQNGQPAVLRCGLPAYQGLSDDEHGVKTTLNPTYFPDGCGSGPSWDKTLALEMGRVIAVESRGYYSYLLNTGQRGVSPRLNAGGISGYSPNQNLAVNPMWGRNQEVFGEDPVHMALLAKAMVTGMQWINASSEPPVLGMVATPKHFAVYNVETIPASRHNFSAEVNVRNFVESYLVSFKASVVDARARSVMSSYNEINGVPATGDVGLLTGILREHWNTGEDVMVISDYDAWAEIYSTHLFCGDYECAAATGLNAGCDQEGGGTSAIDALPQALADGKVTAAAITQAFERGMRMRLTLGLFDPPTSVQWNGFGPWAVGLPNHLAHARLMAAEAAVLLKNDAHTLPLQRHAISKLAVIGPQATQQLLLLGNYALLPNAGVPTLLEGLTDTLANSSAPFQPNCSSTQNSTISAPRISTLTAPSPASCALTCAYTPSCNAYSFVAASQNCTLHSASSPSAPLKGSTSGTCTHRPPGFDKMAWASGCNDIGCEDTSGFQEAVQAANGADVIVITLGLDFNGDQPWVEREAHDRSTMALPGNQAALVRTLRSNYPKTPIVALLIHGGPLLLDTVAQDATSILSIHYPGIRGAHGTGDVLFGDVAAAGRNSITWYASEDDLPPPGTVNLYPAEVEGSHGLSYRFFNGTPAYPFGYGLSYTTFSFSHLMLNQSSAHPCDTISVSVNVTNTGKVDSDHVIQLYLRQPHASVPVPNVRLADFARVHIKAGETVKVDSLLITPETHPVVLNGDSKDIYHPTQMVEAGPVEVYVADGLPSLPTTPNTLSSSFTVTSSSRLQTCDPAWW